MYSLSKYLTWPLAVFLLAALIRLLWLGSIPGGLNQDEASTGYDAWALLTHGIDRHGLSWPVHFIAWGSGQNALYAYLSIPFIAVGGLNVTTLRLAAACLGIISLWLFWRMGRTTDHKMGLWALLVLATSPWHIMASRWALESNAAPAMVLFATYCFTRVSDQRFWLPLGSALLASSVYAYGTAYFFAPVFLLCAWIICAREQRLPLGIWGLSTVCAFVVALPIIMFILNNTWGTAHLHWGPITIPKYPSEARYSGMFLPLAPGGLSQIPDNAIQVMRMLIGGQDDGLPWNASPAWGPQLIVLTPFLMLGIAKTLKSSSLVDRLMLAWLGCALITAFCTSANINRINLIWLPSLWLSARGLWLLHPRPLVNRLAQIALFSLGVAFTINYFASWQERISNSFFPGLGEALQAATHLAPEAADIVVTGHSVYTSTLFFTRPPPKDYLATVRIPDPTSPFQTVESFGRFKFGIQPGQIDQQSYWVAHISELSHFNLFRYDIRTFGNYAAVTRKPDTEAFCYQPLELWALQGKQDYSSAAVNAEVDSGGVAGLPIADQRFEAGFGVHGDSNWSLNLSQVAETLEIGMGLSSSSGCSDGLRFKILLDGKPGFDSQLMKPGELKFATIPLLNAIKLTFITEAGFSNRCDHGLWITPVIKRCRPLDPVQ